MSDDIDQIISAREKRKSDEEVGRAATKSAAEAERDDVLAIFKDIVLPECQKFSAELDARDVSNRLIEAFDTVPPQVIFRVSSPDASDTVELKISQHGNQIRYKRTILKTSRSRTDYRNSETQDCNRVSAEFVRERLLATMQSAFS